MAAFKVIEGGGDSFEPTGKHVLGEVVRSWRQTCRYGRHLETVLELRGVDGRWTEHQPHVCPARPDDRDEHEEGFIG